MKKLMIGLFALGSFTAFADCNVEFVTLRSHISFQQNPQQQLQGKSASHDKDNQSLFYSKSADLSECVSEFKKISKQATEYANPGCNIEKVQMIFDFSGTLLQSETYISQCQQQQQLNK